MSFCVLDFPDLSSFNSALHHIVAQLRLCGETLTEAELITKTLSTFPLASAVLAQQYRNMKFCIHAKLMSFLLLAEKEHQVLVKDAKARPAKNTSVSETHVVETWRKKKHWSQHQPRRQVPKRDKYKPTPKSSASPFNSKSRFSKGKDKPYDPKPKCSKCRRTGHQAKTY